MKTIIANSAVPCTSPSQLCSVAMRSGNTLIDLIEIAFYIQKRKDGHQADASRRFGRWRAREERKPFYWNIVNMVNLQVNGRTDTTD
ncbi:hypothetical protein RRG08_040580 [Elysia crispata]|uniref:Uncharacterized protein n=1 Tax=Elysia crispata TaxID=231223 RepID=A0AAE0Z857_9GAST|nr:hypothetical protein RRG08_040580 [Elysia crispata]